MAGGALTAAMFFAAAIAMAGLPPLSGFVGKLLILDAGFDTPQVVWIWGVVLISSLISVVGFSRAGSIVFWKSRSVAVDKDAELAPAPSVLSYTAVGGLLLLLVAHTVLAGPMYRFTDATAAQLFAPEPYKAKVLDTKGKLTRPKPEGYETHEKNNDHGETKEEGH